MTTPTDPHTIYFAGDIFDHKHLIGNAILADYINRLSDNRYKCILPQEIEQPTNRGTDIRNKDLMSVMTSDFGIFNFDGPDIDSGTVVEFMFAKMLDIPAVIIRTDFRRAGDGDGANWNLMATGYPRTESVNVPSLLWFREEGERTDSLSELTEAVYSRIATPVIEALDRVKGQEPVSKAGISAENLYNYARQFPGSGFAESCGTDIVEQVLARKRIRGLL